LGAFFLWLALRDVSRHELDLAVANFDRWSVTLGSVVYMSSVVLRCVRWGILLRAAGSVKWRHLAETLMAGYAANYLLPGRIGELFRVDYARRLFHMSRFTALGTVVVERVFDGIILICALWISLGLSPASGVEAYNRASWAFAVGTIASVIFGCALLFIVWSRRIDLRRLGLPPAIVDRWNRLVEGISVVSRGHTGAIILCSLGVWVLEVTALGIIVGAFGVQLTLLQTVMLMALASLSTIIPTAPGYLGTYQFVFAQMFGLFGYKESIGIVAATAVQLSCFGLVTLLGILVLPSRSGIVLLRTSR
jgi:uncharacterized protein (TIRG00374 family)